MAKTTTTKKARTVKTLAELQKTLADKRQDVITSRISHQAGELVNPHALTVLRKDIARILTNIRELELAAKKETK